MSRWKKGEALSEEKDFRVTVSKQDLVKRCEARVRSCEVLSARDEAHNKKIRSVYLKRFREWARDATLNSAILAMTDDEVMSAARNYGGPVFRFKDAPRFDERALHGDGIEKLKYANTALDAAKAHNRPNVTLTAGQLAFYFGKRFGRYTRVG